jgi:hypothetical protein
LLHAHRLSRSIDADWRTLEDVTPGPALRYYRSLEGAWLGELRLRVTDAQELRTRSLDVRVIGLLSRLGSVWMATTLNEAGPREFVHTTRVFKWRLTLFESSERFLVNDDERSFRVEGELHRRFGRREDFGGEGHVDESATRATYRFKWLEEQLLQRTQIVDAGLEVEQETDWSNASVLLRRRPLTLRRAKADRRPDP